MRTMNEGAIHKAIRAAARAILSSIKIYNRDTSNRLNTIEWKIDEQIANAEEANRLTFIGLKANNEAMHKVARDVEESTRKIHSINERTNFDSFMILTRTAGMLLLTGVAVLEGILLLRRQYPSPVIEDQSNQVALVCQRDPQSGFAMQLKGPGARPITVYCKTSQPRVW